MSVGKQKGGLRGERQGEGRFGGFALEGSLIFTGLTAKETILIKCRLWELKSWVFFQ